MSARDYFSMIDYTNTVLSGPPRPGSSPADISLSRCAEPTSAAAAQHYTIAALERRNRTIEAENAELRRQLAERFSQEW